MVCTIAKTAGIEMCAAYNQQYGTQYLCAMPTNLYGPGDNYDMNTSHVLPALLRKAPTAKAENQPGMTLWGTGTLRREFLFSEDLDDTCALPPSLSREKTVGALPHSKLPHFNLGYRVDFPMRERAKGIANGA